MGRLDKFLAQHPPGVKVDVLADGTLREVLFQALEDRLAELAPGGLVEVVVVRLDGLDALLGVLHLQFRGVLARDARRVGLEIRRRVPVELIAMQGPAARYIKHRRVLCTLAHYASSTSSSFASLSSRSSGS